MKIFTKRFKLPVPGAFEVTIAKLYLRNIPVGNNLLMETIDYPQMVELEVDSSVDATVDVLDDLGIQDGEPVQIISYNQDLVVVASVTPPLIVCSHYMRSPCELSAGIRQMAAGDGTIIFENYLEETEGSVCEIDSSTDGLPSISDYIAQQPDAFELIYYPGAGQDFSPLQLFGNHALVKGIYFSDYANNQDSLGINESNVTDVRDRLDLRGEKVIVLNPEDFNRGQWADFWPQASDLWERKEQAFEADRHPDDAWGRKLAFNHPQKHEHTLDFYYLGTEGIKTVEVLIENGVVPDVLVLQDHDCGGGWSVFGGADSPLDQVMRHHLPKYILAEPNSTTVMWPGYEQVTRAYNPPLHAAGAQHRNARALFKRKQ
jgi:hypothetical protein